MSCDLSAQILPPDFQCIRSDSLFWIPTPNACGPFESYDIFVSPTKDGPYSLLAQITDPSVTSFHHDDPTSSDWFYFMQSNHDCGLAMPLNSDTIDNQPPVLLEIDGVSASFNTMKIHWSPSESPEVEGYIIYRVTAIGTIPIDTVFGATFYEDTAVDASLRSETYFVLALDPCGNTSLFGEPHTSTFMTAEEEACEQEIRLSWDLYQGWLDGIGFHRVLVSTNGSSHDAVDTLDATATSYTFENAQNGVDYCFTLQIFNKDTSFAVFSNQICLTANAISGIDDLYLKNLDVKPDGAVEVVWRWNAAAALQSAELNTNGTTEPIDISSGLLSENRQTTSTASANDGAHTYSVSTLDDCNKTVQTTEGQQIYLSVNPTGGLQNDLTWTPLLIENLEVLSYEIYKQTNSAAAALDQVSWSELTYSDVLDINQVSSLETCYFIRATSEFTHPDGQTERVISNSNVVCLSQSAQIFLPNAFAPRGKNQIFKPVLSYGLPKGYKMLIFNRFGEQIFQSDDIDVGWTGKVDGRDAPMGVYTYLIQMTQQDDAVEQFSGPVFLVR